MDGAQLALLSPEAWKACRKLRASPASIAALILFIALALSLTYSAAGRDEAVNFLMKYRKLLLLPALFLVFHGSDRTMWGRASIWALFTTLTFTMVLTYTNFLGWTAVGPLHGNDAITKPWVFKDHISGGLMMAFLVCMSMALARAARRGIAKWLLYGVALLALVNVLFVENITGKSAISRDLAMIKVTATHGSAVPSASRMADSTPMCGTISPPIFENRLSLSVIFKKPSGST